MFPAICGCRMDWDRSEIYTMRSRTARWQREWIALPVAALVFTRITTISRIARISGREIPRRETLVRGAPVGVRVRRRIVTAVGVVVATRGRIVVQGRTTSRRRGIPGAVVVVVATGASVPVVVPIPIPSRAVAAGRRPSVIVITWRRIRPASRRRRGARTATRIASASIRLGRRRRGFS